MLKRGARGDVLRPKFSILNPELTMTLPPYQTAAGITDIMIHIMERYFTTTENVEVTDRLCEGLLKSMITEGKKVIKNPKDYDARANIMWCGMLAHNNVCGVGRNQDWASHGLEHELSALYDVAHGAGLAVMAPAWLRYVLEKKPERLVNFAVRVWNIDLDMNHLHETAVKGIEAFETFLKEIGMPSDFAEVGGREEDIPYMAENIVKSKGSLGGYVKLDKEDIIAIYKSSIKKQG